MSRYPAVEYFVYARYMAQRITASPSKAELTYQFLREQILTGGLRSGQRISMDELSRDLGVSKIPIREAMARLQSEGLVLQMQHVGAIVATVGRDQLRGVFAAREALEPVAARLAAARMDEPTLAALNHIQDQLGNELASARATKWSMLSQFNSEFHVTIARLTGFDVFVEFTESLLTTIRRYRITAASPGNWESTLVEHAAIIDAFDHGTEEDAERAARAHVVSQMNKEISTLRPHES